jgi:hypothetical protein
MGQVSPSRRRERRRIVCRSDGSMFDVGARHRVTTEELRDHLQDGGLFEAVTEATGRDCTLEVLRKIMLPAGLENAAGAPGGLPGMGALGSLSQLGLIANLIGDSAWRHDDRERDSERPRARSRRRSGMSEDFLAEPEPKEPA